MTAEKQTGTNIKGIISDVTVEEQGYGAGKTMKVYQVAIKQEEGGAKRGIAVYDFKFVSQVVEQKLKDIMVKVDPDGASGTYPCVIQIYEKVNVDKKTGKPYKPEIKLNDILPYETEPTGPVEFELTTRPAGGVGAWAGKSTGYKSNFDEDSVQVQMCMKAAVNLLAGTNATVEKVGETTRALHSELVDIIRAVKAAKKATTNAAIEVDH